VTLAVAIFRAANSVEVPWRTQSWERCSISPRCRGGIGWVRSSAWIWDFSSTHSTTAFSGRARSRPSTSVTLPTSSGSVENPERLVPSAAHRSPRDRDRDADPAAEAAGRYGAPTDPAVAPAAAGT
jgi:hypothetical protein